MRGAERAISLEQMRQRKRWYRRVRFWLFVTGAGAAANLLAVGLPGAVPLLLGNIAPLALMHYLRWPWTLTSGVLVAAGTGSIEWGGFALLHCLLAMALARTTLSRRRQLYGQLGLTGPLAFWLSHSSSGELLAWISGGLVLLVGISIAQTGAWQLAQLSRNPAILARRSMGSQLASTLIVATMPAMGMLLLVLAHLAWQVELLRRSNQVASKAHEIQELVEDYVLQHRRVVELTARIAAPGELPRIDAAALTHPGFLTMMVSDAQGRIVDFHTPGQPAFVGAVADRDYFQRPRATGKAFVSPVFRGRGFGQDILVAVSAPYVDTDQRFAGIVQGALSLAALQHRITESARLQSLQFVVLDASQRVVAATVPDLSPLDSGPFEAITLDPTQTARSINLTHTHLLGHRTAPELGWRVALLDPLPPLAAMQTQAALAIGMLCMLAMAVIGWQVRRLSRAVTSPLQEMLERVRQVDLDRRDSLRPLRLRAANAEFAELRDDFNAMLQRIRELNAELRKALSAQEALNLELEARVEQRTAELRATSERAQHLAHAKSVLLANMSHELRTPLTAILGHTEEALRTDRPRCDWEQTLRVVLRNGRHLLDIVNDVLDAGRIDAGQLRVEMRDVELVPLLQDVVAMFSVRAFDKGIELDLDCHWPLPALVHTDPLRLRQILINLLGNAIKFTESGSVKLCASHLDGHIRLAVQDSGIGMTEEQRSRLFRPFEQADVSTTRRFGGSGLGLYISARLAEALGGEISVESVPGRGSIFSLSVPVSTSSSMQADAPVAVETPNTVMATPVLAGRVLVVDDVEDLRTLTAHVVGATGIRVETAADGAQAVEQAMDDAFDLVLMDMHMPVLDGRQATIELRRRGYRGAIVALSADVLADDVERFRAAGCDEVLSKPIDRTALYATLQRFLMGGAASHAGSALPPALEDALAGIRKRFQSALPTEAEALRRAIDSGDHREVRERLHRLKGSCGTFGFNALSELAEHAETTLRDGADWMDACLRLQQALDEASRE